IREELVEPEGLRRSAARRSWTQCAITKTGGGKIGPEPFKVELSSGSAMLGFVDGCLSRGGDEVPGHKPMVRRVPWNTGDINHRRRIVHSSDDDVKDATAILSRTSDALNGSKHVHQLSRAQCHRVLRTVETLGALNVAGSNPILAAGRDLGKSFARSCLLRFGVLVPTQYQCCSRERI